MNNQIKAIKKLIKDKKVLKDMFSAEEYKALGKAKESIPFPSEIINGVIYYSTIKKRKNTHRLVENDDESFYLEEL